MLAGGGGAQMIIYSAAVGRQSVVRAVSLFAVVFQPCLAQAIDNRW